MSEMAQIADRVVEAMRGYVGKAVDAISKRVGELEVSVVSIDDVAVLVTERVAAEVEKAVALLPEPENGRDGRDGVDGHELPVDLVEKMVAVSVAAAVAQIPVPRDGKDGNDGRDGVDGHDVPIDVVEGTVAERVAIAVAKTVAQLPVPQNGRDGTDGKDGTSVPREIIEALITTEVAKFVAALPRPDPGRDGKDGESGRDSLEIEVLHAIDPTRSYARGTFASHRGGTVRSFRATDPITDGIEAAGWQIIMEGIAGIEMRLLEDERSFELKSFLTSGKSFAHVVTPPAMIHRGIWTEREFERGDMTTWDGSTWHCQSKTTDKPGTSAAWKLVAKRGRDGKDGKPGDVGDRGTEGKPGRDLTQMNFDGKKY